MTPDVVVVIFVPDWLPYTREAGKAGDHILCNASMGTFLIQGRYFMGAHIKPKIIMFIAGDAVLPGNAGMRRVLSNVMAQVKHHDLGTGFCVFGFSWMAC